MLNNEFALLFHLNVHLRFSILKQTFAGKESLLDKSLLLIAPIFCMEAILRCLRITERANHLSGSHAHAHIKTDGSAGAQGFTLIEAG
jgi:hypothetical protein